ncbi:MAG: TrkH family potassium uptake protein [Qingshengfaniella sp.]
MTTSEHPRRSSAGDSVLDRLPFLVVLAGVFSVAMLIPAFHAGFAGDHATARPFLYGAILFFGLTVFIGLAAMRQRTGSQSRELLLSLVTAYLGLPLFLALPVAEAVPGLSLRNAYFEMVSAITTTGATVFDQPRLVADSIHLWRALVGWMGGFLVWVSAIAILAPLRLGGFEVVLATRQASIRDTRDLAGTVLSPMRRIRRHSLALAPVYGGLTLILWLCLLLAGELPLVAVCHAMSVMATSGISPLATLDEAGGGTAAELVMFAFMIFALGRFTFASDMPVPPMRRRRDDPEMRIAVALLVTVPTVIFIHHWMGTLTSPGMSGPLAGLNAYWGSLFTTMSFLSTAGFVSADWDLARSWSGLSTPGLILMGLALVGGGVATTAGGVKLLRIYALYRHGQYEMGRLIHPHAVASPGHVARRIGADAAYIAWLFFMLFALSIAAVMTGLSLAGVDFETAMLLAVAALTNTGPLIVVAGDQPVQLATLPPMVQYITCVAMALGRLETLALVALFNPAFWRA